MEAVNLGAASELAQTHLCDQGCSLDALGGGGGTALRLYSQVEGKEATLRCGIEALGLEGQRCAWEADLGQARRG